MEHPIASLSVLLDSFSPCFRQEVFNTFRMMFAAWAMCIRTHTISEVSQTTGQSGHKHHDAAYSLWSSAKWEWDELGNILLLQIVARLVPTGNLWIVVDDTLCHKRGAKVAFGGFFLDAVMSTKKQKHLRFGLNWVVLGITVHLPFRPDRYVCLPILWRVYKKKGQEGHKKRTEIAAELAKKVAGWLPDRDCWLVADSAYVNSSVLKNRPANLKVIGPVRWDAALYKLPEPRKEKQRGATKKKGERLPTPREMIKDDVAYPSTEIAMDFLNQRRTLRVKVVRDVLWYSAAKSDPLTLVLVQDAAGEWRDEVLLATSQDATAEFVIAGYCRRWSVEVAFHDSKQFLGLHDPQVRTAKSVERAHPMAWFVTSVTVLWYAVAGKDGSHVHRDRPWYKNKKAPTFSDMLGAIRFQLWEERISSTSGDGNEPQEMPKTLKMLINYLAAVG